MVPFETFEYLEFDLSNLGFTSPTSSGPCLFQLSAALVVLKSAYFDSIKLSLLLEDIRMTASSEPADAVWHTGSKATDLRGPGVNKLMEDICVICVGALSLLLSVLVRIPGRDELLDERLL
jgi:hypothetical protein